MEDKTTTKAVENNLIRSKAVEMYYKMFEEFETGVKNTCNNIYMTMFNPCLDGKSLNEAYRNHKILTQVIERLAKEKSVGLDLVNFEETTRLELQKLKDKVTDELIKKISNYLCRQSPETMMRIQRTIADYIEKIIC